MSEELKKLEELLANDRKIIEENYKEIEKLQSKNKKIQTILRTRARQDRKRKAKLRKLRLETTNQRLKLERLHSIIKEVREYIENNDIMKVEKEGKLKGMIFIDKGILEILDKDSDKE